MNILNKINHDQFDEIMNHYRKFHAFTISKGCNT